MQLNRRQFVIRSIGVGVFAVIASKQASDPLPSDDRVRTTMLAGITGDVAINERRTLVVTTQRAFDPYKFFVPETVAPHFEIHRLTCAPVYVESRFRRWLRLGQAKSCGTKISLTIQNVSDRPQTFRASMMGHA